MELMRSEKLEGITMWRQKKYLRAELFYIQGDSYFIILIAVLGTFTVYLLYELPRSKRLKA